MNRRTSRSEASTTEFYPEVHCGFYGQVWVSVGESIGASRDCLSPVLEKMAERNKQPDYPDVDSNLPGLPVLG